MERKRMGELVRRGRRLDRDERHELRTLVSKLEPAAFAFAAADRFSPIPLRRFGKRQARRRDAQGGGGWAGPSKPGRGAPASGVFALAHPYQGAQRREQP